MCDLSRQKLHRAKAKWKGGSIIDSDEDAQGEPELKRWKISPVRVMEIRQLAGSSLSLFQDLLAVLRDHVMEQRKQTAILAQIACIQEMDGEDWAFDRSEESETGMEGSEEGEEMQGKDRNGHVDKQDKGKGKQRAEDGNADRRKDWDEGGNGNGEADGETLQ